MQHTIVLLVLAVSAASQTDVVELARSSGVQGGILVHLGCGDGRQTAKLWLGPQYVVHGLDVDQGRVTAARQNIHAAGLYGKVSVSRFDGRHLPYADNLINLVIDSTGGQVPREEILRVLVPGGVAFVGGRKLVKPWPKDMDDWGHFLHGPDNNAVARDRRVGIPRSIQWTAGPKWGRSHEELASVSAAVVARGRLFAIVDEGPLASIRFPSDWKLVARDAFNGTLLWKRPIGPWVDRLRHFRSGPVHLPRRLVAVGDTVYVTLGLDSPVVALDGATGQTIREYPETAWTEEILVQDGVLYLVVGSSEVRRRGGGLFARGEPPPSDFRFIAAVEADTGKRLWKKQFTGGEFLLPLTLAVRGERVYYQSTAGVGCLDAATGRSLWLTPRPTPARRMAFSAPTLVATDEVVLCADRDVTPKDEAGAARGPVEWGVHGWNEPGFPRKAPCTLTAYAAQDGRPLWSTECREGYNSPVDVFVIGRIVWVGPSFKGLDLLTGELAKQLNTAGPRVGMTHPRCYRNKATERFILTSKSGVEVISLQRGWLSNNSWIRGTCQYGIIPAHGLLYAPPDACACFLTVKVPGFFAAATAKSPGAKMPLPEEPVLEKGRLYGEVVEPRAAEDDWPMYRHDPTRSGRATCPIPANPKRAWTVELGGRLTQPVVARGTVYVASVDAHTVYALDARTGRVRWRFTAGGRVDSSPTIHRGSVLFGSADGWVYALGAATGDLAWRFRAAPAERLVGVEGQLESTWPVHGAVLVQNDTLYVTAGRSSYLDGGIVLYAIDPVTGKQRARTVLSHLDPETGQQLVPEARFNMEGTTSDVLTGDGERVYLKYFAFDRTGRRTDQSQPHLFSITGLLDEVWFVRTYWVLGEGMPGAGWGGWANAAQAFPFGRILCFDEKSVYGYGRRSVSAGPVGHRADVYHLFCRDRSGPPVSGKQVRRGRAKATPIPFRWSDPESLIVRAMVLGQRRLAVAGPVDVGRKDPQRLAFLNQSEALAAFLGHRGVKLRVVGTDDGRTISEIPLPAMPVFDGMAAAQGRLFVSLKDGSLVCLGD
ncbi:MAG TPA: methyltransferase domain-containing protein [Planctomycetaceae bacterium]|nr:methyltransferase domain-containing protein [Planctomycetaceae bacterium]HIQ23387.1 methyltransferase domain-containing protein [Planctomycetota bacterium]